MNELHFNALRDKLRQLFLFHAINLFENNNKKDNDLTICVELLLSMMNKKKRVGAILQKGRTGVIHRPEYPNQLLLNFSFFYDAEMMDFIRRLNVQYGTATARPLLLIPKDKSEHLLIRAIGINLAVLIERIFPEYAKFIQMELSRNIVRKKYYQCVTGNRQANSFESKDAILNKYALISESYGLTKTFNSGATFLVAILMHTFGIDTYDINMANSVNGSFPQPGTFNESFDCSVAVSCTLLLVVPETTAKVFLENISKQFPGAANLNEVYTGADSKVFEICIDKETLSGPIFELYKAKLAHIAENDPEFLERLQIQCKTRQKSTSELVAQLNGVAQQVGQTNPKLAEMIVSFSSILTTRRKATNELKDIDWQIKSELNRIEAGICDAKDEAALNEFKKVKKGIREVERAIGLRPR